MSLLPPFIAGHAQTVIALIGRGASIAATSKGGVSSLSLAAARGHVGVMDTGSHPARAFLRHCALLAPACARRLNSLLLCRCAMRVCSR